MAQGKFSEATKLLPKTFREVYAQPKVREQIKAVGMAPVKAMVEFQLGILASIMVTGGNLNDAMIDMISDNLIELYPTESIADFRLCLQRGAMGRYGEIQRMDGITIGVWMTKYMEEKYTELENAIEQKKLSANDKEPIDNMKDIYAKMANETAKYDKIQEFNKQEMHRRFGKTPRLFVCDGLEIYAPSAADAAKYYKQVAGKLPEKVEQVENRDASEQKQ
jgi:hypothetical protein